MSKFKIGDKVKCYITLQHYTYSDNRYVDNVIRIGVIEKIKGMFSKKYLVVIGDGDTYEWLTSKQINLIKED